MWSHELEQLMEVTMLHLVELQQSPSRTVVKPKDVGKKTGEKLVELLQRERRKR